MEKAPVTYFVTDNICRHRLSIECYSTEEMIGDFFTKPLQGALFYKLWSLITNLNRDKSVVGVEAEGTTSLSKAKECVGSSGSSERSVLQPGHFSQRPVLQPGDFNQGRI